MTVYVLSDCTRSYEYSNHPPITAIAINGLASYFGVIVIGLAG